MTGGRMHCPNCSKEIRDTAKVCGYCGHRLQITPAKCPECGNDRRDGAKVCGYCGHKFASPSQMSETKSEPAASSAPDKVETQEQAVAASAPDPESVPAIQKDSNFAPEVPQPEKAKPATQPAPVPLEPANEVELKPISTKDDEPTNIKAAGPQASKRKLGWVWIPIILILTAGAFYLIQTNGWFAKEAFAGAIGNWEGRDGGDGSNQTLSIRRTVTGSYKVIYIDDSASACNGAPAWATMEKSTSTSNFTSSMEYFCKNRPDEPAGMIPRANFIYNPNNDTILDSWGDTWRRQE